MSKIFRFRIDSPPESEWYLNMELLSKLTVLFACFELGSKTEKPHFHALLRTDLPHDKLNEFIRKSLKLPSYEQARTVISTKLVHSEDLEHQISYGKKDGDLRFLHDSFTEQYHSAPDWIKPLKLPPPALPTEEKPLKQSKPKFSMYQFLESHADILINMYPDQYSRFIDDRRYFTEMLVSRLSDKAHWVPQFRISNWNTFYSYIAQIHWGYSKNAHDALRQMPSWL